MHVERGVLRCQTTYFHELSARENVDARDRRCTSEVHVYIHDTDDRLPTFSVKMVVSWRPNTYLRMTYFGGKSPIWRVKSGRLRTLEDSALTSEEVGM